MADLGPQVITGATAVVSFLTGFAVEWLKHRQQRRARHQDERASIYGGYISAIRGEVTRLSAVLYRSEPIEAVLERARSAEDLVGPMRLYSNEEIRAALDVLSEAQFHEVALDLHKSGLGPAEAVTQAWATEMRAPVERLEEAMRKHLEL